MSAADYQSGRSSGLYELPALRRGAWKRASLPAMQALLLCALRVDAC